MSRSYKLSKNLERTLTKLKKKDKKLHKNLLTKMEEVINNQSIEHYKNLKHPLHEFKRVHIGSFVLLFKHDRKNDLIYFTDFNHHDKIYH